jgi:hypothetical protein
MEGGEKTKKGADSIPASLYKNPKKHQNRRPEGMAEYSQL